MFKSNSENFSKQFVGVIEILYPIKFPIIFAKKHFKTIPSRSLQLLDVLQRQRVNRKDKVFKAKNYF